MSQKSNVKNHLFVILSYAFCNIKLVSKCDSEQTMQISQPISLICLFSQNVLITYFLNTYIYVGNKCDLIKFYDC